MQHNLLAISYAKRVLESGSREQERMKEFAAVLDRYVMVVFSRETDGLPREYHAGNLSVYGTHAKTKIGILWQAFKIGRRILKENPGQHWLVSSQNPFEASLVGYPISAQANATHHVQIHGDNFANPHWRNNSVLNMLREWFGLYILYRTKRIRVVSQRISTALVSLGISADSITVLPVQISLAPFLAVGAERDYSKPKTTNNFLFVGRFEPEKNIECILQAFHTVYQQYPHIRLRLVGAGGLEADIKNRLHDLNITSVVSIRSWTNDIAEEMKSADTLLLASQHEGFGLVLLEALAAGLSVVTTDVGCANDIVQDQVHGYVVPVGSKQAFSAAVKKIVMLGADNSVLAQRGYVTAKAYNETHKDYAAAWKATYF